MTATILSSRDITVSERRRAFMRAPAFVVLAALVLLVHAYLVACFGLVGFAWLVAVTVAALFTNLEFAFALLVVNLFLQNSFLAIASPVITDASRFTPLLGGNFLSVCLTSLIGIPVWLKLRRILPARERKIFFWLVAFAVVTVVYSAVGVAKTSLSDVLTYTRVDLIGGLMLLIGIAMGFQISHAYTVAVIRVIAVILVVWGFVEFFWTDWLYRLFNIVDFLHLEYANSHDPEALGTLRDIITAGSSTYLNLSGKFGLDWTTIRLKGPNIHPISYAYGLAFCAMVCYVYRYNVLLLACLAMMSVVGAKGPLLMVLVPLIAYPIYKSAISPRLFLIGLAAACVLYTAVVMIYGTISGDYHVIGLLGGLRGFMHNPVGHGVGIGGNLSNLALLNTNFDFFENYGADFALESAIGVMLYQIGIGAFVFFGFYWQVGKGVWRAIRAFPAEPRLIAVPVVLAVLLVNGIFQEEALSPEGWGLIFLFAGLLIARYWRGSLSAPAKAVAS